MAGADSAVRHRRALAVSRRKALPPAFTRGGGRATARSGGVNGIIPNSPSLAQVLDSPLLKVGAEGALFFYFPKQIPTPFSTRNVYDKGEFLLCCGGWKLSCNLLFSTMQIFFLFFIFVIEYWEKTLVFSTEMC